MTKHTLTSLELYILADTLLHSISQGQYWTGSATKEARDNLLKKLQIIMNDINVEILTSSPEPITLTSDTGI